MQEQQIQVDIKTRTKTHENWLPTDGVGGQIQAHNTLTYIFPERRFLVFVTQIQSKNFVGPKLRKILAQQLTMQTDQPKYLSLVSQLLIATIPRLCYVGLNAVGFLSNSYQSGSPTKIF